MSPTLSFAPGRGTELVRELLDIIDEVDDVEEDDDAAGDEPDDDDESA